MKEQLWRQYVIAAVANIGIVTTGYFLGWTSPINLKLKDETLVDSPLPAPITIKEEAWLGSLLTIGALLGPFIAGPLSNRIGRKWALLAGSVPLFVGWVLVAAATSVGVMYAGRVLWGISMGMIFVVSPMYCAEIATDDSRGALGSYIQLFVSVGFLLIYGIGPYVSYSVIAYVGVGVVALFAITFFFMPESPIYHLMKNDRDSAAECLMTIRGRSRSNVEAELDLMVIDVAASIADTATILDVFKGSSFKAIYIICALMLFQQFSGINAIFFYLANIFEAAGSGLDASVATIIVGAVQLGASFVTPFTVDRLGRRMMLFISTCGVALGLIFLGIFFLLDDLGHPAAASMGLVPVVSLAVFTISYSVGIGPIPWAMVGELFPVEVKTLALPIVVAFYWGVGFVITRFFGPIAEAAGMYVVFWIFGAWSVAAFFFTLFVVPETRGKSFAEIQEMLSGNYSYLPEFRPTKKYIIKRKGLNVMKHGSVATSLDTVERLKYYQEYNA